MSELIDEATELRDRVESVVDEIERHVRVLDSYVDEPEAYDDGAVGDYLEALEGDLDGTEFLESAEEALTPLEEAVDEVEEEFLGDIVVVVDDREIEDVEFLELEPSDDPEEAEVLVDSPKVNQLRGGAQRLELPDGRDYEFRVEETLVAEVEEDKTGKLKLILGLSPM